MLQNMLDILFYTSFELFSTITLCVITLNFQVNKRSTTLNNHATISTVYIRVFLSWTISVGLLWVYQSAESDDLALLCPFWSSPHTSNRLSPYQSCHSPDSQQKD